MRNPAHGHLYNVSESAIDAEQAHTSMKPHHNRQPFVLQPGRPSNSQAETVLTDVGHPTSEGQDIPRSLGTPCPWTSGIDYGSCWWTNADGRREAAGASWLLRVEDVLEVFNLIGQATDIFDIATGVVNCGQRIESLGYSDSEMGNLFQKDVGEGDKIRCEKGYGHSDYAYHEAIFRRGHGWLGEGWTLSAGAADWNLTEPEDRLIKLERRYNAEEIGAGDPDC